MDTFIDRNERRKRRFPISVVSEATGVNIVTLRAWERRYGFLKPERTPKGHRLYSEADIALVRKVVELLESGISVGQIEPLLRGDLPSPAQPPQPDQWRDYIDRMLHAVEDFDEERMDRIYNEAMSNYPSHLVTQEIVVPLLGILGNRWQERSVGIAEEHFLSVYIRNKLGARWHHSEAPPTGPTLLAACVPGEQHEYGLLLFALLARARGFRVILLGANMPLEQLAPVIESGKARGIVLSAAVAIEHDTIDTRLARLCAAANAPVFIGGRGTEGLEARLEAVGAIPVGSHGADAIEKIYTELHRHQRGLTQAGEAAHRADPS